MSESKRPVAPMRTTPVALIVAGVVIIALIGVWWAARANGTPEPQPNPSPTASPTTSPTATPTTSPSPSPTPSPAPQLPATLLWQVRNDDLLAVDNLLIGTPTSVSSTALLYVPGGLLVDAGAAGEMTLARTALLSDTLASPRALSGLLGVEVTGAFVLDRLAFAGLVDAVDGVWVITSNGRTHLSGGEAADYVLMRSPGESEAEGIARFSEVMQSVFLRLPDDVDQMRQLVTSLGVMARSTIPTQDVVALLMSTHAAVRARDMVEDVLPTSVLRPGLQPIDSISQPAALQMLVRMFPRTVLRPGEAEPPRVLLQVGVTNALEVLNARDAIVAAGYQCVSGRRVADQLLTTVHVPDESTAAFEIGARLAAEFNLPESRIVVGGMSNPTVDAEVVLGADWKTP